MPDRLKSSWMQAILAAAILVLITIIVAVLLVKPPAIDERTAGVLMTIVGVLIACLKDVYQFYFGSSAGSQGKDETIAAASSALANSVPAPSPASPTSATEPPP